MADGRNKLVQRCFFLIPKNVTSERPIVLMPTLIRWWEASGAPEVAKWQKKCRVEWDATDGPNGGAQQTVWEILTEMERFSGKAKEMKIFKGRAKAEEQEAVALVLVLDLAKAFERVSLPVVWAWATHFSFARKILRVLCGSVYSSKDVRQSRSRPSRLSCQGRSGVACSYGLCCRTP